MTVRCSPSPYYSRVSPHTVETVAAALPSLRFEVSEAAEILRMSRAQLYNRIHDGSLKPQKDGARRRTHLGVSRLTFPGQGAHATDNLVKARYRRLTPPDLIDVAIEHDLHFDRTTQQGVTFNLIGAVAEFGKLGIVSIATSPAEAEMLCHRAVHALDAACA